MNLDNLTFEEVNTNRQEVDKTIDNEKDKIKKSKEKKLKLWGSLFNKNKLKKPKMVAVVYLRNNGRVETYELESRKGFFQIGKKHYAEDEYCIYHMKDGTPLAVIPEWSLTPIGRTEWYDKDMQERFASLVHHVLTGIRNAELVRMGEKDGLGSNLSLKWIVGIALACLIGYALLSNYIPGLGA